MYRSLIAFGALAAGLVSIYSIIASDISTSRIVEIKPAIMVRAD